MAVSTWLVLLAVIAFIFWRLWKLAISIEQQEAEEEQWLAWIDSLRSTDPYAAYYWQNEFDQRFRR